jgi:hypothetical protein
MSESEFNGKIDGKPVKVIVRDKGWKIMYFAKPIAYDVDTPHFEQKVNGTLELHEDSADGKSFRVMSVDSIHSGSFYSGSTFAQNKGMDIAVLPMTPQATGFAINTSESGSYVSIPSGSVWCLMAMGSYGPWQAKPKQ